MSNAPVFETSRCTSGSRRRRWTAADSSRAHTPNGPLSCLLDGCDGRSPVDLQQGVSAIARIRRQADIPSQASCERQAPVRRRRVQDASQDVEAGSIVRMVMAWTTCKT